MKTSLQATQATIHLDWIWTKILVWVFDQLVFSFSSLEHRRSNPEVVALLLVAVSRRVWISYDALLGSIDALEVAFAGWRSRSVGWHFAANPKESIFPSEKPDETNASTPSGTRVPICPNPPKSYPCRGASVENWTSKLPVRFFRRKNRVIIWLGSPGQWSAAAEISAANWLPNPSSIAQQACLSFLNPRAILIGESPPMIPS